MTSRSSRLDSPETSINLTYSSKMGKCRAEIEEKERSKSAKPFLPRLAAIWEIASESRSSSDDLHHQGRKVPISHACNTHILLPSTFRLLCNSWFGSYTFLLCLSSANFSPATPGNKKHQQIWLPLVGRHSMLTTLHANVVDYQRMYTMSYLTIIISSAFMISLGHFPASGSATMSPWQQQQYCGLALLSHAWWWS